MEINAREARQRFSEPLDRVERGEEVVVTRRGRRSVRPEAVHDAERTPTPPPLADFGDSLAPTGEPVSATVIEGREDARY